MGLFDRRPTITVPKIGQIVWIHHLKSDKVRPFIVMDKYGSKNDLKISGIYLTTQFNPSYVLVDDGSYADCRRVEEISLNSVKSLDGIIKRDVYIEVVRRCRSKFINSKYKK